MKKIRTIIASVLMVAGFTLVPLAVTPVAHASVKQQLCQGATGSDNCTKSGETTNLNTLITRIINILLFLIGAISVIMIIVGGLKYVTSSGDSSAVSSAKNTVMYAIVGLIIAVMAYAIVNFVVLNISA